MSLINIYAEFTIYSMLFNVFFKTLLARLKLLWVSVFNVFIFCFVVFLWLSHKYQNGQLID